MFAREKLHLIRWRPYISAQLIVRNPQCRRSDVPQYLEVPPQRLAADVLRALYEDYVTRDGTDYGERELALEEKVERLAAQVQRGDVRILYDIESEQWDLVPADEAAILLDC